MCVSGMRVCMCSGADADAEERRGKSLDSGGRRAVFIPGWSRGQRKSLAAGLASLRKRDEFALFPRDLGLTGASVGLDDESGR